jgi:lipopolysaccharide/colanic/teichoic acid biosynthesis glycosyltransferase
VNSSRPGNLATLPLLTKRRSSEAKSIALNEETFHKMIALERKRTERSRNPFLLMLLETGNGLKSADDENLLSKALSAFSDSIRETDVTGWYEGSFVIGVMFTQLGSEDRTAIVSTMLARVTTTLRSALGAEQFSQVSISLHLFPEGSDHQASDRPINPVLYPDLLRRPPAGKLPGAVKRVTDVAGSALALVVLAPLFLVIAVAIKLSSKGPVLFRQKRIGQYGVPFVFLKFRSMYANNDASVHKEYVCGLIRGQADRKPSNGNGNGQGVYKLTSDARITLVGRMLRRTSLDELPQFLNVLNGEMSLVGPRPPIDYEVAAYDLWHRRRLLEAKPGITGLWQVNGRSRVKFDDMVRLDLQYAKTWSPWLDLKILVHTPRAVALGEGGY